jgi:SAM-dependent methyltransferase
LVRFATDHEDALVGIVADAAALPLPDQSADQVVACMSLQDVDDLDGAVCEIGRVLRPGGVFCMAILHPFSTAGEFADQSENSAFVVERPYPEPRRLIDTIERDGLEMEFHSMHRPLSAYTDALHRADLMIETITEPVPSANAIAKYPRLARELTVPWFLHLRARKPLG